MKENAPEKSRANVLIILGHFQKWLTVLFIFIIKTSLHMPVL